MMPVTRQQTPKRPLFIIVATVLLNSIGFGIIMPVMPKLVMEVTGQGLAQAALYGGWLMFAYAIMQFFFAPVLGNLGDRFGRRRVLLVSLIAFSLDYLVMGWAPTLGWLFAGRFVAGIAAATNSTANAYIADISPAAERPQNFGLLGAAFGVGFIIGPVLGGMLGEYGTRAPFYAAAALGVLNLGFTFFALPESLPREQRRPFELARANPFGAVAQLTKMPIVLALVVAVFLYNLGHFVMPAIWSYYTIERFGWSPREIGYSLGYVGILSVLVQGYLTRIVIPRVGPSVAAYVGLGFALVAFLGYAFAPSGWMMYVVMLLGALSGFTMPALQAIMTSRMAANTQGELQGAIASANALTAVIGPPLMTQLFGYFSSSAAPVYFPGAAFLAAAMLTATSLALLHRIFSSPRMATAGA